MSKYDELKRLAEAECISSELGSFENPQLCAAILELIAEADRANYWKQRAKSAEGHLFASDWREACKALHKHTAAAATDWDELSDAERAKIGSAAASVIAVVAGRLNARRPQEPSK